MNKSQPLKVIIENFPETGIDYLKYITVFISLIAVIISLVSMYYTRKSFLRNSRPYLWSGNFGYIDKENKLIFKPQTLMFQIKNVPAKVKKQIIKIVLIENDSEKILFSNVNKNFVRYPSEKNQWTFDISEIEFNSFIEQIKQNNKLQRICKTEYCALNDSKIYFHELKQEFVKDNNNWKDVFENAN